MPNHVTTVCTVTGPTDDIEKFYQRHICNTSEDKLGVKFDDFDFETIIPKPDVVKATESGSESDLGYFALTGKTIPRLYAHKPSMPSGLDKDATRGELMQWLLKNNPTVLAKGAATIACLKETGSPDWYEWSIKEWGTKWGAYNYELRSREPGKLVFKFETAWSFPTPIFEHLRTMHPSLTFTVIAFDEGWNFGVEGVFNATHTLVKKDKLLATEKLYERVYGYSPA